MPLEVPSSDHANGALPLLKRRRTRASIACSNCRNRKTRCDNGRPSCGYCSMHGATCHYPSSSGSPAEALENGEIEINVSNNTILDRVNEAVALLEDIKRGSAQGLPHVSPQRPSQPLRQPNSQGTDDVGLREESAFADAGFGQLEVPHAAARTSACESLLRWPIISEFVPESSRVRSFGLEAVAAQSHFATSQNGVIPQDSIIALCRRFLALIHIKNPVLDVPKFIQHARNAAEFGPGWDEGGCLVLLACALAYVSIPYDPIQIGAGEKEDLAMAEACFSAAQRRLGLLPSSLVSIQCQYFAGLYEKFLIRPMKAWSLFQASCAQLQAQLYAKHLALESQGSGQDETRARHLEQRLYWSCFKAECELRTELQLPFSGRFKYPDLFPALSFPSSSDMVSLQPSSPDIWAPSQAQSPWSPAAWQTSPSASVQTPNLDRSLQPEEETSWLHYLAEISLRSIMNRVLVSIYNESEDQWSKSETALGREQDAFVEELEQWHTALPPQLAFADPLKTFPDTATPSNELSFFLQSRFVGVLEWIFRPSIFIALCTGGTECSTRIVTMATKGTHAAAILIKLVAKHHRHGGIWGLVRRSFGSAILLIAVALRSHRDIRSHRTAHLGPPPDWMQLVELCLATIKKWTNSWATDLNRMEVLLRNCLDAALLEMRRP